MVPATNVALSGIDGRGGAQSCGGLMPSRGACQSGKVGAGEWVEKHPHRGKGEWGEEGWDKGFVEGNPRRERYHLKCK